MEKDPVCGMDVEPENTSFKTEYQGKTYYFCSQECLTSFQETPEKFIQQE